MAENGLSWIFLCFSQKTYGSFRRKTQKDTDWALFQLLIFLKICIDKMNALVYYVARTPIHKYTWRRTIWSIMQHFRFISR